MIYSRSWASIASKLHLNIENLDVACYCLLFSSYGVQLKSKIAVYRKLPTGGRAHIQKQLQVMHLLNLIRRWPGEKKYAVAK